MQEAIGLSAGGPGRGHEQQAGGCERSVHRVGLDDCSCDALTAPRRSPCPAPSSPEAPTNAGEGVLLFAREPDERVSKPARNFSSRLLSTFSEGRAAGA